MMDGTMVMSTSELHAGLSWTYQSFLHSLPMTQQGSGQVQFHFSLVTFLICMAWFGVDKGVDTLGDTETGLTLILPVLVLFDNSPREGRWSGDQYMFSLGVIWMSSWISSTRWEWILVMWSGLVELCLLSCSSWCCPVYLSNKDLCTMVL